MKKLRRIIASLLPVLLLLTFLSGNAQAALQAVGPLDLPAPPGNGFATWYQDTNNVALEPCLTYSVLAGAPACILPPAEPGFDPTLPIAFPTNYPFESFYFNATAVAPAALPSLLYEAALEATFGGPIQPGMQVAFTRIRIRMDIPSVGTYTVTHPYGTETFDVTTPGVRAINMTRDLGINLFPAGPVNGDVGPWLVRDGYPQTIGAETFIGLPGDPGTVTGSPTGNNLVRVDGPNIGGPGINTVTTNSFAVQGKVFTDQIPSPLTIDRTTYARDAASGQIDVFVTALPTAILTVSGTGITNTNLTRDLAPNTTKYFTHIPLASSVLPTSLIITNSLDVPPVPNPIALVDEVIITQASYNPATRSLTIKADSRDNLAPLPTLTVPQFAAPNTLDATGTLVKTLPANTIPPLTVTVRSSRGGSATSLVSVVVPGPLAITTTSLANGAVNAAYNQTVAATGGTAPFTWSATGLPSGLFIDPATGIIFGIPANVVATGAFATFPVTVTITDGSAATVNTVLNLRINQSIPAAPSGLATTSPASNQVVLAWADNANNENVVQIDRATNNTFTTGLISVVKTGANQTSYIDTTVVAGTTYFYRVRVGNTINYSAFSNTATITVNSIPLAITSASLPNGAVNVAYSQGISSAGGFAPLTWSATGLPPGLTINPITGVISGIPLTFSPGGTKVFPVSVTVRDSAPTPSIVNATINLTISQTLPLSPTSLTATAVTSNRVDLAWTDTANNENVFRIQRATNNTFTTGLTSVVKAGADQTAYIDTTVVAGTTYFYRVSAGNAINYSAPSNTATVTTP